MFALFFAFGGITSLNDVLIPKLKGLFTLSMAEALTVQSAFFAAYFLVSIPASAIVRKVGYMRSAVVGLVAMTIGCLLFVPASSLGIFPAFLAALFVLAAGITIVQVVANPLISMLGPTPTSSSRLTFAQAFNSLGTTLFPYVGSMLILGANASAQRITHTYIGLAIALAVVAAAVWSRRNKLRETMKEEMSLASAMGLFKRGRFALGTLGIFAYVGAEVTVGSLMVIYLQQKDVLGLDQEAAGKLVAYYWGGAMIGRFAGSAILRMWKPAKVLSVATALALVLIGCSVATTGLVSGYTLIAIGLANSIMFPTIFTLACEGLGPRTAEGSGIMCMAIVGGAILPPIAGLVADHTTPRMALVVPAISYAFICAYGFFARGKVTRLGDPSIPPEFSATRSS